MFEYLTSLDASVSSRYTTMIKNLRSGSNSFFDAYRELIAEYCHFVLESEGCAISKKLDLSKVLSHESLNSILVTESGVLPEDLNKIKDFVLKINKHVHKKERTIDFEIVTNYLLALYKFTAPYCDKKGFRCVKPGLNEIHEVYEEYERVRDRQQIEIDVMRGSHRQSEEGEAIKKNKKQDERIEVTYKVVGRKLVYNKPFSQYKKAWLGYVLTLLVFNIYNVIFIWLHLIDYSVAYVLLPYQIFTLIHFINLLKIKPDIDPYDFSMYSMFRTGNYGDFVIPEKIKKRHILFLVLTVLFSLLFIIADKSYLNIHSTVKELWWMYIPIIIMAIVHFVYGFRFYSNFDGNHVILSNGLNDSKHMYIIEGKSYNRAEYNRFFEG